MEPWEALDIDDSDLPSLLRPCKRQNQSLNQTNHNHTSHSQSVLQPCSRSQPTPKTQSQTLGSQHSLPHFDLPPSPPPSTSRRIIPGPAGAVQAAMLRKTRDNQNRGGENPPIPTQEYIRRAVEEGNEDDGDFKCNPWLCALEFLRRDDGVLPITPLSSIKKCLDISRVDQVVAVIKSCTSNGLGDLIVTLKDPTGTIGASIHRKVLTEGEFGKDISVGSVLILQKVAVFVPSRAAHYLNITKGNMVKVICKDTGPLLKQSHPALAVKHGVPGNECRGQTGMPQNAFSVELETTVMDEVSQCTNLRGRTQIDKQMEKENLFSESSRCNGGSNRNHNVSVGKEPMSMRQDVAKNIIEKTSRNDVNANNQVTLNDFGKQLKGDDTSSSIQPNSVVVNLVENHNDLDSQRIIGVQKERQPPMPKAELPLWTDEQLHELFATDFEDDGSLF
ncbi:uncharacterized protein LOC132284127 [Cornus florida]|uniref:uncharacterized protein LOC132284127 n=1 Tax=Cornus florida TaxID=4283 RepID=UPI00289D857E|nr:uncharacterized protein LOC132284127 [Cornus florida]